jgi:hypothetical protein
MKKPSLLILTAWLLHVAARATGEQLLDGTNQQPHEYILAIPALDQNNLYNLGNNLLVFIFRECTKCFRLKVSLGSEPKQRFCHRRSTRCDRSEKLGFPWEASNVSRLTNGAAPRPTTPFHAGAAPSQRCCRIKIQWHLFKNDYNSFCV